MKNGGLRFAGCFSGKELGIVQWYRNDGKQWQIHGKLTIPKTRYCYEVHNFKNVRKSYGHAQYAMPTCQVALSHFLSLLDKCLIINLFTLSQVMPWTPPPSMYNLRLLTFPNFLPSKKFHISFRNHKKSSKERKEYKREFNSVNFEKIFI